MAGRATGLLHEDGRIGYTSGPAPFPRPLMRAMPEPPSLSRSAVVRERPVRRPPALVNDGWHDAFPWLVHGTTVRGDGPRPFDLGLFSDGSPRDAVERNWERLANATGMHTVVHAEQPHGSLVRTWTGKGGRRSGSLRVVEPCDAHVTDRIGVLLAVTVADCVPVFVVDPRHKAVAMIHAGWRGAAAGILEEGLAAMEHGFGTAAADVFVHLGPSICGACYEVGPEVFEALGRPVPEAPTPIDLRACLTDRALAAGVDGEKITCSAHCTLCGEAGLFSHRRGHPHRQVGYIGISAGAAP